MLRAQTYEVRYTYPNLLYISWKHHEKEYILRGSPIMNAMLATQSSKPRGELRGQSGSRVRFAETVVVSPDPAPSLAAPYGSNPRAAPPRAPPTGRAPARSVTDYQPPSAFLDAIEQPIAEPRKSALDDFLHF
jgi:hypothetical protein